MLFKSVLPWIFLVLLLVLSYYGFQTWRAAFRGYSENIRKYASYLFIFYSTLIALGWLYVALVPEENQSRPLRQTAMLLMSSGILSGLCLSLISVSDDLRRGLQWGLTKAISTFSQNPKPVIDPITRSQFFAKFGAVFAAIPIFGMWYGFLRGAYNYQIHREKLGLKNLPIAFEGFKIIQISDIHSGSFFNKAAVMKGIQMILNEKPDLIVFTGDLVNQKSDEIKDYLEVFALLKAPFGVYSIMGNHDYALYGPERNFDERKAEVEKLHGYHKQMGWDLLLDESRTIEKDGQKIYLAGVQNWGKGRFPKFGRLEKAVAGLPQDQPIILLSHDPSHWTGEILPKYPFIDLTLSGHTHGMQFGIEVGDFKWSPSKYVYPQWAGLYQEQNQTLYVNRGFGFIGFPGRVGINPEITIIEFTQKA